MVVVLVVVFSHSFSVKEIQKNRLLPRSSKSYSEDFLKKQNKVCIEIMEDGNNSSSEVSFGQEVLRGRKTDIQEDTRMFLHSTKVQGSANRMLI